jgi:hypothetical protein
MRKAKRNDDATDAECENELKYLVPMLPSSAQDCVLAEPSLLRNPAAAPRSAPQRTALQQQIPAP